MAKKKRGGLADPSRLEPVRKKGLLQVVVETPKASRNKYAFDPEQEVFVLKKVLTAGMAFPYDFGFLPRTLAEDGDPILKELKNFFVNYHRLEGKRYRLLGCRGISAAQKLIKKTRDAA